MQSRNKYPPVVPVPVSDWDVVIAVLIELNDGVDPAAPTINSARIIVAPVGVGCANPYLKSPAAVVSQNILARILYFVFAAIAKTRVSSFCRVELLITA